MDEPPPPPKQLSCDCDDLSVRAHLVLWSLNKTPHLNIVNQAVDYCDIFASVCLFVALSFNMYLHEAE